MNFGFGFTDNHKNIGYSVFVDLLSKIGHFTAVTVSISAHGCARVFIHIYNHPSHAHELVSDRDPRCTVEF